MIKIKIILTLWCTFVLATPVLIFPALFADMPQPHIVDYLLILLIFPIILWINIGRAMQKMKENIGKRGFDN